MANNAPTFAKESYLSEAGFPELPADWEVVQVEDLLSEDRGISVGVMYPGKHDPNGVPLIKAGDMVGNVISPSPEFRITPAKHEEYRRTEFQGGEILMTLVGTVGQCAIVPPEMRGWNSARAVAVIRLADGTDADYVRQCFLSRQLKYLMNAWANTTVQPTLNLKEIRKLPLPWPPEDERDAIASILGALDDKIELNRRMNATLESLARAIFKSWFVDFDPVRWKAEGGNQQAEKNHSSHLPPSTLDLFPSTFQDSELGKIPQGWSTCVLDDITKFVIGGDWGKETPQADFTETVHCIRGADIPHLQNGGLGKMPTRYIKASSLKKRGFQHGDIAFEISGGSPIQSTGRPVLATKTFLDRLQTPLTCSNFCRLIRFNDNVSPFFVYCSLRWLYDQDEFLQYENGTTGIKNLAFKVFSSLHNIVLPPDEVMTEFDQHVSTYYERIARNGAESVTLSALRDTLLPKLLSGELPVPEALTATEEAIA